MNDDTKAVQGDALSARTTAPKFARSSLGRHAHRFDDSPISFQVTLPDGSVQRFGKAAPRFAVTLKNSQALRGLASLDEGRIGEAYLAGDLDIDGDMLAPFALRGSLKDFHPVLAIWRFLQPLLLGQIHANRHSAFTYYTGFRVNSGEYKVMGLAPYGEPRFKDLILNTLIDLKADGSFRLDQSYFDYATGLNMTNEKFSALFGEPVRKPETELLTQFHMDIAASLQAVTEEVMLRLTRSLAVEYDSANLCLAGGVALNCVANGKILRDGAFKSVWVQPAAGDAGGAIGAALAVWHKELGKPRRTLSAADGMKGAYLGPDFAQPEIEDQLKGAGASFEVLDDEALTAQTAAALAAGKAVGWFQGRMEFGPRALGNRLSGVSAYEADSAD